MKGRRNCLIIDDDLDDQEIFLMCIKKISSDIDCKTSSDGVDALLMLRSDESYMPDYIFLDVNMPKMNGIDCLKHLKSIKRLNNTKVFMYSTTSAVSTVVASKELGADFIIKPTKTADLKEKLRQIFNICLEIDA